MRMIEEINKQQQEYQLRIQQQQQQARQQQTMFNHLLMQYVNSPTPTTASTTVSPTNTTIPTTSQFVSTPSVPTSFVSSSMPFVQAATIPVRQQPFLLNNTREGVLIPTTTTTSNNPSPPTIITQPSPSNSTLVTANIPQSSNNTIPTTITTVTSPVPMPPPPQLPLMGNINNSNIQPTILSQNNTALDKIIQQLIAAQQPVTTNSNTPIVQLSNQNLTPNGSSNIVHSKYPKINSIVLKLESQEYTEMFNELSSYLESDLDTRTRRSFLNTIERIVQTISWKTVPNTVSATMITFLNSAFNKPQFRSKDMLRILDWKKSIDNAVRVPKSKKSRTSTSPSTSTSSSASTPKFQLNTPVTFLPTYTAPKFALNPSKKKTNTKHRTTSVSLPPTPQQIFPKRVITEDDFDFEVQVSPLFSILEHPILNIFHVIDI
jgi:hypothetical protein